MKIIFYFLFFIFIFGCTSTDDTEEVVVAEEEEYLSLDPAEVNEGDTYNTVDISNFPEVDYSGSGIDYLSIVEVIESERDKLIHSDLLQDQLSSADDIVTAQVEILRSMAEKYSSYYETREKIKSLQELKSRLREENEKAKAELTQSMINRGVITYAYEEFSFYDIFLKRGSLTRLLFLANEQVLGIKHLGNKGSIDITSVRSIRNKVLRDEVHIVSLVTASLYNDFDLFISTSLRDYTFRVQIVSGSDPAMRVVEFAENRLPESDLIKYIEYSDGSLGGSPGNANDLSNLSSSEIRARLESLTVPILDDYSAYEYSVDDKFLYLTSTSDGSVLNIPLDILSSVGLGSSDSFFSPRGNNAFADSSNIVSSSSIRAIGTPVPQISLTEIAKDYSMVWKSKRALPIWAPTLVQSDLSKVYIYIDTLVDLTKVIQVYSLAEVKNGKFRKEIINYKVKGSVIEVEGRHDIIVLFEVDDPKKYIYLIKQGVLYNL